MAGEWSDLADTVLMDLVQNDDLDERLWIFEPVGLAALFRWPFGSGALEVFVESLVAERTPGDYRGFFDLWLAGGSLWLVEDRLVALDCLAFRSGAGGRVSWTGEVPDGLDRGGQLA